VIVYVLEVCELIVMNSENIGVVVLELLFLNKKSWWLVLLIENFEFYGVMIIQNNVE
jgi:hypothetical protein